MWTNKHGALSMFRPTEQSQPGEAQAGRCQAGELACHIWATDVPQVGQWRASALGARRRPPTSPAG
jgi:hypothetical protein